MFTGLVQNIGEVVANRMSASGALFSFRTPLAKALKVGDSIAVNGACLTASEMEGDLVSAFLSSETLTRTNLGNLQAGDRINLELPVRADSFLGGHWVQGHIDGLGEVVSVQQREAFTELSIRFAKNLSPYFVEKGSVTVDGVSLTVNGVSNTDTLSLMIIPKTLEATTLGDYRVGRKVNLETDILAKYAKRWFDLASPSRALRGLS